MLPKPHLFGWNRAWPPDDRAAQEVDAARDEKEREYDGEDALPAASWLASEPLRQLLASEDLPMPLGRVLAQRGETAATLLGLLVGGGYVREYRKSDSNQGAGRFGLTEAGWHTLPWAGAPKPEYVPERGPRGWAGQLAFALSNYYGVSTHDMLHSGFVGRPVVARARLCAALRARGWRLREIEDYFWMPREWAERGVARWHGGLR